MPSTARPSARTPPWCGLTSRRRPNILPFLWHRARFRRVKAANHAVIDDVFRDDRACGDARAAPDANTRQEYRARANHGVVFDDRWTRVIRRVTRIRHLRMAVVRADDARPN